MSRSLLPLVWIDNERQPLPDTSHALPEDSDAPGLLAAGGTLSIDRLREAYTKGIFPWYNEGQPVLWWSPDPRMVLPVAEFRISRSLRKALHRFQSSPRCEIRIDHDYEQVMQHCADVPRHGQSGTWIVDEMVAAYTRWHHSEHAVHSIETWMDGELAGGLYVVNIGRMVFGESMFALRTDASKIALAALVAFCRAHEVSLIDCQQRTSHLASLGAREWPRRAFELHLSKSVKLPPILDWKYDSSMWAQLEPAPDSPGGTGLPRRKLPPESG